MKSRQAKQVKGEFEKALSDYQKEEVDYRNRYRDQIARQYKIAYPNATEEEVREAGELDWGNEGVFTTAVSPHESSENCDQSLTNNSYDPISQANQTPS